jgi:hypothetical protein
MFDPAYVVVGFVIGMLITTIFVPPVMVKKMYPDINSSTVMRNPSVENGCFKTRAYQISCTERISLLNGGGDNS